jgi:hypothetical protein
MTLTAPLLGVWPPAGAGPMRRGTGPEPDGIRLITGMPASLAGALTVTTVQAEARWKSGVVVFIGERPIALGYHRYEIFGQCQNNDAHRGNTDDRSIRAFAVKPRAFGAPPLGAAEQTAQPCHAWVPDA